MSERRKEITSPPGKEGLFIHGKGGRGSFIELSYTSSPTTARQWPERGEKVTVREAEKRRGFFTTRKGALVS